MIEYFLKPNVKTVFFKAILKFCTTNQLFNFLITSTPNFPLAIIISIFIFEGPAAFTNFI